MNNKSLSSNALIKGTIWGISSKIIDAGIKFFTIPLLIALYGKSDYGLFALAFSLNAYLRIMEMGMNTGSIRYFSIWFSKNEIANIKTVSKSSIVFYGLIGIINAIIFIVIGLNSDSVFNLNTRQYDIFLNLCYILAFSAVFNWISYVFTQLLSALQDFVWLNKRQIFVSLLNLILVFLTFNFRLSLINYFVLYTITNLLLIPLYIYRLKITGISRIDLIMPKWDYHAFSEVLKYSLSIFAIGIFQYCANYLRPVFLAIFSKDGVSSVTEYRVIETITHLIIAFSAIFLQNMLPISSKSIALDDNDKIKKLINTGTKYVTIFLVLIVSIIVLNSRDLLTLYLGEDFAELSMWLNLWCFTILLGNHNSPVASMVLAKGKTKPLVYATAFSAVLSLFVLIILAPYLSVGAAVVGYFIYMLLQISFYYGYYTNKLLKIDSFHLFVNSFFKPVIFTSIVLLIINYSFQIILQFNLNLILKMTIRTTFFIIIYIPVLLFVIINKEEKREIKEKIFALFK